MALSQPAFAQHRRKLMASMPPNSIAIIPAAPVRVRSRDTDYHYRQSSDFYYLSGFEEPEALIVLVPQRPEGEFIIFCRPKNKQMEIWEGVMAGPDGALEQYGADQAFAIADADTQIPQLLDGCEQVYYALGQEESFDRKMMTWLGVVRSQARAGAKAPDNFSNLETLLHEQRLIKSDEEVALMAASCELAAQAHVRAMTFCKPGAFEYQLEAEIAHTFAMAGARSPAYNTIVGGGNNACILHYTENNQVLNEGDLVLIDAGCELAMYAADITRTFPVSGVFSEPQKALYNLTLKAQEAAFEAIKPGNCWNEPHDASVRVLTEGFIALGLLEGETDTLIKEGAYKRFYMHRVGHWLGMDVHDVGAYKVDGQWRTLQPGMVMTVEPGIYVAPDDEMVDEQWRGIGIRIEDNVLVTEQGHRILTESVPKAVSKIETLMAGSTS